MATRPNHPPSFLDKSSNNDYTSIMGTTLKKKKRRTPGRPVAGPDHPLANLRLKAGHSRETLAELIGGMTADQIAAVEYRRSRFPVKKLARLAEVFGLKINDKLINELYPEETSKN